MTREIHLFTSTQIRQCEQLARTTLHTSEDELIERAGQAALNVLSEYYPKARSIAVFCGGGKNGGDGYVLARLAYEQGFKVVIYQTKNILQLPAAATKTAKAAMDVGIPFRALDDGLEEDFDLIVDALSGTGLKGRVSGRLERAIEMINGCERPVLAIDVPSGLNADTGEVSGVCVKADVTVTFIAPKIGLYTADGPDHCGEIHTDALGVEACVAKIHPCARVLNQTLLHNLTARPKNSHKNMFGHVLVIGGGPGMPGAAFLSALAALRVGAGTVTLATHPAFANVVLPGLPEAMVYGIQNANDLRPLLMKASVSIVGPGLGESPWAHQLFSAVLSARIPLLIDASALKILAANPQHDDNRVLTPHPGEAASLLGKSTADVQADRLNAAAAIQKQYGGHVVLKGTGTIVHTNHEEVYVCSAGNPGMASAGMGDVLSGVIGALIAQGLRLDAAAKLGVWLHAKAADEAAAKQGERGLLASDLMPFLRRWVNLSG